MTPRYIRNEPGPRENATAAFVSGLFAGGLGVVLFYFLRLVLARDEAVGSDDGAREA